uniref:Lambda-hexatoxin-Hv1e n=1 Tax=Hadronyche versuta TaxID=6904 RepID=TK1E_HADVE|nr:RecName: Full=Lambda-hexatoxin-Hv1e; Short=Lambda-HXTX-Hv1e; AltName: Full=Kappa-hexatoxin-Hv1e; Flags: Precursor [Hadronyche versuta]CDF44171.1 kappa-hexatoxin-Hv1e insecticidal toxin [Hadronyche versuta]
MNTATCFIVLLVVATVIGGIEAGEFDMRKDVMGLFRRAICPGADRPCAACCPCCPGTSCKAESNGVFYCRKDEP